MNAKIISTLMMLLCARIWAQQGVSGSHFLNPGVPVVPTPQQAAAIKADEVANRQKYFIPRDPWRVIHYSEIGSEVEKHTVYAKGAHWVQFFGKVTEVTASSVILDGWYGAPMDFENGRKGRISITDFPYQVELGMELPKESKYTAFFATSGRLFYGVPTAPPSVAARKPATVVKKISPLVTSSNETVSIK